MTLLATKHIGWILLIFDLTEVDLMYGLLYNEPIHVYLSTMLS